MGSESWRLTRDRQENRSRQGSGAAAMEVDRSRRFCNATLMLRPRKKYTVYDLAAAQGQTLPHAHSREVTRGSRRRGRGGRGSDELQLRLPRSPGAPAAARRRGPEQLSLRRHDRMAWPRRRKRSASASAPSNSGPAPSIARPARSSSKPWRANAFRSSGISAWSRGMSPGPVTAPSAARSRKPGNSTTA